MKKDANPTVQWLRRAPGLRVRLANLLQRIDRDGVTPKYERAAAETDAELLAMEKAIDSLEDPRHQAVLSQRYLCGPWGRLNPWRQVAMEIYQTDDAATMTRVYRMHKAAVSRITVPK